MADKIKWLIATSDNSSYILKPFAWLFDKHCPECEIEILGYSVFPELPERYKCISLAEKQESFNTWAINLYSYIKDIKDEFVIFGLDDFFVTKPVNYNILNSVVEIMERHKRIGRYELGIGHQFHEMVIPYFPQSSKHRNIYKYSSDALYRVSTQFSVWRTEYLLHFLSLGGTPFEFETEGSKYSLNDGYDIIATDNEFAVNHVWSGAISSRHPGMINIEGVNHDDIEEMIALGILDREKLQYGMKVETNPRYV